MPRPVHAFILAALLLLTNASQALALEAVGRVLAIEGEAFVERRGEPVFRLSEEDRLFEGDMVETTPDSQAHISMKDGTEITVDSDTALKISLYDFAEEAGSRNRSLMDLVRGSVLYLSGAITRNGGTAGVKTGYGSLGIRGTEFWVGERITDMGKGLGVFVNEGAVEVRNWSGSVRVKKGLGTNIYGYGHRPGKPRAWSKGVLDKTFGKMKQRRAALKQHREERIEKNIRKLRRETQQRHENRLKQHQKLKDRLQEDAPPRQKGKQGTKPGSKKGPFHNLRD